MVIRLMITFIIHETITSNQDLYFPDLADTSGSASYSQQYIVLYKSFATSVRYATGGHECDTEDVISFVVTPRAINSSSQLEVHNQYSSSRRYNQPPFIAQVNCTYYNEQRYIIVCIGLRLFKSSHNMVCIRLHSTNPGTLLS